MGTIVKKIILDLGLDKPLSYLGNARRDSLRRPLHEDQAMLGVVGVLITTEPTYRTMFVAFPREVMVLISQNRLCRLVFRFSWAQPIEEGPLFPQP